MAKLSFLQLRMESGLRYNSISGVVKNVAFVLIMFLDLSCSNNPEPVLHEVGSTPPSIKKLPGHYYEDIDDFKLEGIGKLETLVYPCIQIEDSAEARVITFHISDAWRLTFVYIFLDKAWFAKYQSKGDTSIIYSYEYILPDRIITFNYSNIENFDLLDATLLKDNKYIGYVPEKDFIIKPSIGNLRKVIQDSEWEYVTAFTLSEKVLKVSDRTINPKGEIEFTETICYHSKNKSFLWFYHFGHIYLEKMACD